MSDPDARPKPPPRSGDAEVLALAEGLVGMLGKTYDRDGLETLRGVVDSYPDVGRDGAGEVVASLIGLLNDLIAHQQIDKEALLVHVRAWRFMVSRKPDQKERAQLIDGLRSVRDLYDEPKAA
ncbi:hypothetical protein [uncultured Phenylobacterium sp.]|uniref:hypothetical protein n=1 Tax=uncultured Phenylobacterium sp. TaxID=349273 RepID=UPI0025F24499|nr:hypothetical protein [uncultured Phenylobacterium sp.]